MSMMTAEHIALTEKFIGEHPSSIVIQRAGRVSDGAGGFTKAAAAPLAAQTVRKVGISGTPRSFTSADGHIITSTNILIALPDADIEAGDTFSLGGHTWEVLNTGDTPPWRLQCEVYRRG